MTARSHALIESLNVRKEVGTFKAYTREFPGVRPQNVIIQIRFTSSANHEAMIQAVEVLPAETAR